GLAAAAALVTFIALPRPELSSGRAARRFALAIGVALAVFVGLSLAVRSRGAPIGAYTTRGAYSFVTAPALHPPVIHTVHGASTPQLAPGYIFTANFYD